MPTSILRSALVLAPALLLALSCSDGGAHKTAATSGASASAPAASPVAAPTAQAAVHNLKCGCAIDSVGKCGNYIEVEGKFVALKAPIAMGPMEFCHKDGLKARADGQLVNGTFVATSFAYEK